MELIFIFIIGTAIGSFANVLIDRLANDESIMGRSHCDHCGRTLEGVDLIPVISYVLLRGRCRRCRKKLSIQYPIIELLTGVIFIIGWITFPDHFFDTSSSPWIIFLAMKYVSPFTATLVYGMGMRILFLALLACIEVIFITDAKYQLIPDGMQIALFTVSFLLFAAAGLSWWGIGYRFISAVAVMAPILAIYLFTKGRGMGFGDVKLAVSMGLLLGIKGGFVALYIAFIVGAVAGSFLMLAGRKGMKSKIAFGPFLLIGTLAVIYNAEFIYRLISRYYGL